MNTSLDLLDELCELLILPNEEAVKKYLLNKLPELQEDTAGNLYKITPGTPCMVAHMDNVGSATAHDNLYHLTFGTESYSATEENGRLS